MVRSIVSNLKNTEVTMQIDILTLFPAMFDGPLTESILKRAQEKGLLTLRLHDIRDYATDKHRTVDDAPYGGMVMMPGPLVAAIEHVRGSDTGSPVILLTPQGRVFTQKIAQELAGHERLILVCGRYEGVDERVRQLAITDEISIGDYVITGGELAAMIIVDAVARLIPGVLGAPWGAEEDSHAMGLLEYPHYTRPSVFHRGLAASRSHPAHLAAPPGPVAVRGTQRGRTVVPGRPGRIGCSYTC